jgi:hypothetical protein
MFSHLNCDEGHTLIITIISVFLILSILSTVLIIYDLSLKRASLQAAADASSLAGANIQAEGKNSINLM